MRQMPRDPHLIRTCHTDGPGTALFFAGMVRRKNATSVSIMSFVALTWMLLSCWNKRSSELATTPYAVADSVVIAPVAGFVSPIMGIPIGIVVAFVC